jgi:hypothetical protein
VRSRSSRAAYASPEGSRSTTSLKRCSGSGQNIDRLGPSAHQSLSGHVPAPRMLPCLVQSRRFNVLWSRTVRQTVLQAQPDESTRASHCVRDQPVVTLGSSARADKTGVSSFSVPRSPFPKTACAAQRVVERSSGTVGHVPKGEEAVISTRQPSGSG